MVPVQGLGTLVGKVVEVVDTLKVLVVLVVDSLEGLVVEVGSLGVLAEQDSLAEGKVQVEEDS